MRRLVTPFPLPRLRRWLVLWAVPLLLTPATASPQSSAPPTNEPQPPAAPAPAAPNGDTAKDAQRFLESVTVSATLNPTAVKDTPGTVTVIDASTIQRQLMQNVADLVKFEPGVYVETVANRIGLNGFNIRGIGGNRVMTQVDGVETSEQFDFGPFNVHQFALDLDTLKSAEIVRSAGSSLYGSDALGGVVSFFTKDPQDYLPGSRRFSFGAKALYDGRSRERTTSGSLAGGNARAQAVLFTGYSQGHEPVNQGTIEAENATRTALNPQDRDALQLLGKVTVTLADGNVLRGTVETADQQVLTEAYASRTATVRDIDSDDTMRRRRVSVDQQLVNRLGLDQWSWNLFGQTSHTDQIVDELQTTAVTFRRHGTLNYSQDTVGGALQGKKAAAPGGHGLLFTFGGSYKHNAFDMLRDRLDTNQATGAVIPATTLILPSKYFPKSDVGEAGTYLQGEARLNTLTLLTGVRYDHFSLDADDTDPVYIATLSPPAADFEAGHLSARLGAAWAVTRMVTLHTQFADGFRAPPYNAINSGFTNLLGGYTSIPNTALQPETSHNFEAGVRATTRNVNASVAGFWNRYDDFIVQAQRGINTATGLLEFQYQNLSKVRIRGVELQADASVGLGLRLRASYAVIRGDDVSSSTEVPLNTIAPDQGVVALQYAANSRWGSDFSIRTARGQTQERAGTGLFAPEAYAVLDATGWLSVGHGLTLRGGVLNLADRKYFEWSNVRGRQATDPVIDRYSSPGISGIVSLSYGF